MFALGAGDRVVGVSTYCRYPPVVLSLPKVGTYMKPDPEKIALLHPDLVFIQNSAFSLAETLSSLGIPHREVKIGSLEDVYSMIAEIGSSLGLAGKAAQLDGDIQSRLNAIRAETKQRPQPTVLIVVGRTSGLLTNLVVAGSGTYLEELLAIAGGRNVLSGTSSSYPHISVETVVRLNPDVILDASGMGSSDAVQKATDAAFIRPWLAYPDLAAVRNGRVVAVASESVVTPGPRVIEAVRSLLQAIQGQAKPFRQ